MSALTLALDACTSAGTVAVLRGTTVLAEGTVAMRSRDEERLMPAVVQVLDDAGVAPRALDRIVCGGGPGSFTSLRIAAGIAKGLALALNKPLYAVPSLALVAASAPTATEIVAALDALRGEWYASSVRFTADGALDAVGEVRVVGEERLSAVAAGAPVVRGDATHVVPHVRTVARMLDWIERAGPVALEAWEPAYGRLAEAQVKWEAAHGRALTA
ncbi:MAG: tRNA (adenosine(37)-N6)-threonylcarbamoyltransferase complex dimerization subunit type 1 TsaB [Gemmatimonadaceae bacterium]|nr:tRNA (adenosine(37)-N6)-threonylcarbamoyltransferase complex dimerization subunit type 1 TsaB [Gemmatimonadaceae bacterium]